ncbi:MAG: AP2/ERF family transcription factor [Pseudomonadota bacterium]
MRTNNNTSTAMYGISRIDDPAHRSYAWRVSLRRRGKLIVKNFTDKKHGGKGKALQAAKKHRDQVLADNPPLSRKEFSSAKRRNNRTGITGVYTYAKRFTLKDGTIRETWYWEANWPGERGESLHRSFSVRTYGEDLAKQLAIRAREEGMRQLSGVFWASERGELEDSKLGNGVSVCAGNEGHEQQHVA